MSTQGKGTAMLLLAAPLGVGVGAGILIGKGIMWCGEQLEHYCEEKIRQDAAMEEAARNYSLSQATPMKSLLVRHVETMIQAAELDPAKQESLRREIQRVRAALVDVHQPMPSAQDVERESLLLQLTIAIESSRALLTPHIIARAEHARNSSLHAIREAIALLEEERQHVETEQTRQVRQRGEVQRTLRLVKMQLTTLDEMLTQMESAEQPDFIERQHTLVALIDAAQANLDAEPMKAQQHAEEAQRVAHTLTEAVSSFLFDAWVNIRRQISEQVSTLKTVKGLVSDAKTVGMAQEAQLDELTQRITSASNELETIKQSSSLRVVQQLNRLAKRIEFLKEDVLALIGVYQQHTIAETIATILSEMGFQGADDEPLTARTNGNVMRVVAMRSGQTSEGMSDDKLISFDVSRSGDVSYDFSGYSDASCVDEAEKIFAALRLSGIYLIDTQLVEHLQEAYPEGVSTRTLDRLHYQLQPTTNKLQLELTRRIQSVLEQMRFTNIQQSAVGGCIELDAFNGPLGYHVVLSPEGTMQVFKGTEQIDVTADLTDQIVAEAQQFIVAKEEQEEQEREEQQQQQKKKAYRKQQRKRVIES